MLILILIGIVKSPNKKTKNKYEKTINDTSTFFIDSTGFIR